MLHQTPRQRVRAALARQEPDRLPVDLGGTYASGIITTAYNRLCAHLGMETSVRAQAGWHATAQVDERVLSHFQIDTRGVAVNTPDLWATQHEDGTQTDGWGVTWKMPEGGHFYVIRSPLAGEPTVKEVERFPMPDPEDPRIVEGLVERVRRLRDETDFAVCLSLPSRLVHQIQFLRGYAEALVDLATGSKALEVLMDRITDFNMRVMERVLRLVGSDIDVLCIGDDLGTQNGPLLNPELYRRQILPRQRRLAEVIHKNTSAFLFYHSCGAVAELIPDLLSLGVQVLNPVQVSAQGMDPARLKREFGRDLSFWGGIDSQRVLPQGTAAEVATEVVTRFRQLGTGGGWVCAAVHNIQPEVPPENIVALFETVRKCAYSRAGAS